MPDRNYFEFFDLKRKLQIDVVALEKQFYALSRRLHPDRFASKPPAEQAAALAESSLLNDAYRTLKDPVARMKAYLAGFDPSFLGATGTPAQLASVRKDYGVSAVKTPPDSHGAYGYNHSAFIYLIDRAGRLRALSPYGRAVDDVVHDVRVLLAQ